MPILRDLEDRWGTAVALAYLGRVEFEQGNTSAAAAPLAALLPVLPPAYVAVLAGLAVLPSFQEALGRSLAGRLRFGATTAFVVAATPFALGGITSAFWALIAGVMVSLVAEPREFLAQTAQHKGA